MYSNMCVKIALCLALMVSIDGYVLKHRTLPLSAEGKTVDITVRSKEDPRHPLSTMKIDINEKDKTVEMSKDETPSGVLRHLSDDVPTLGDRIGGGVILSGLCPAGYTPVGNYYCMPNDPNEEESE